MHLFASIYLEGLYLTDAGRKLTWCMYPGHDGQYTPILDSFVTMISRQFHEYYLPELIQRHTEAIRSSSARSRRQTLNMDNQLQTIQLNPVMREKITKRSMIVIDDFTTQGFGFETARNFLFNAGAESVTCIAVGKYPKPYIARYPKDGITWDSFMPVSLTENDFAFNTVRSIINDQALRFF